MTASNANTTRESPTTIASGTTAMKISLSSNPPTLIVEREEEQWICHAFTGHRNKNPQQCCPSAFHPYHRPCKRQRGDNDTAAVVAPGITAVIGPTVSTPVNIPGQTTGRRVSFNQDNIRNTQRIRFLAPPPQRPPQQPMQQEPQEQGTHEDTQYTIFPLSFLPLEYLETLPHPQDQQATQAPSPLYAKGAPSMFEILTQEDCQRLWYQKSDTVAAKERLRALVVATTSTAGTRPRNHSRGKNGDSNLDITYYSGCRYGLDKVGNWERAYQKKSALWYVLAAHRESTVSGKSWNHEFVRQVSERCTQWARHVAEQEGMANFWDVYGDYHQQQQQHCPPSTSQTHTRLL